MLKRWRRLLQNRRRGQALVEFALVLLLIMTTLGGGVLVIQALFLQQRLIDIVTRAAEWGASTNNNDQIDLILNDARGFSNSMQFIIDPPDPKNRPIGSTLRISVIAQVPMFGAGVALTAQLGASTTVLIEHNPMRFATPAPPAFTFHYGDYVRVQTTAGENLRVHLKPGINSDTHFVLYNGDKATIIEGPVEMNGLRWWKIYATGRNRVVTGWCVDKADAVDTLVLITKFF